MGVVHANKHPAARPLMKQLAALGIHLPLKRSKNPRPLWKKLLNRRRRLLQRKPRAEERSAPKKAAAERNLPPRKQRQRSNFRLVMKTEPALPFLFSMTGANRITVPEVCRRSNCPNPTSRSTLWFGTSLFMTES